MHSMERGPNPSPPSFSSSSSAEEDEIDHKNSSVKRINDLYSYNRGLPESNGQASVRIKIPGRINPGASTAPNPNNPNPGYSNFVSSVNGAAASKFSRDGFDRKGEMRKPIGEIPNMNRGNSGVSELVAAIHSLGDGFMRMEKMKMDMVRQIEEMRMEMELKRTKMNLESEQRVREAFAKAIAERSAKRAKRNSLES